MNSDVFCQQGVFNSSNQPFSHYNMWGLQVTHANQRHSMIKMINFRHMLRTQSTQLSQCHCLKICPFLSHWPRFPYTTHVWKSLQNRMAQQITIQKTQPQKITSKQLNQSTWREYMIITASHKSLRYHDTLLSIPKAQQGIQVLNI